MKREAFIRLMNKFHLPEIDDLAFIDEYPKVVEPLRNFIPTARQPEETIRGLDRIFNIDREQEY